MENAVSTVEYITRSTSRVQVLLSLNDGAKDLEALELEISASGRTVRRAVDGLIEEGWVNRCGHEYAVTSTGSAFATRLGTFLRQTETLLELQTFFEWFPDAVCSLDPIEFEDATVTVQQPHSPYQPLERTLSLIDLADEIKTIAPINSPFYNDSYYERITDEEITAETVLPHSVFDAIRNADTEQFQEVLDTGRVEVYVCDLPLSFGLLITENMVAIGAYDHNNSLRALIESNTPVVREWAEDVFAEYKNGSEKITTPINNEV